eukprot:3790747-Lingulodinium_polyedra.AAC.1
MALAPRPGLSPGRCRGHSYPPAARSGVRSLGPALGDAGAGGPLASASSVSTTRSATPGAWQLCGHALC